MGVMTEQDVRAAQTFLDSIRGEALGELELRGALAAHLADVRTAGYLEGVQRGRQEAAHVVLDALRGEGLAP